MDTLTPQDAIEWLVKEHTCQWCGEMDYDRGAITAEYCCREVKKGGYVSKEWRYWRRCGQCCRADGVGLFGKWIFPAIGQMANRGIIDDLVAV